MVTETRDLTDVMAKIDHIRRLAEGGTTQHEAEVAAAMMNKLLMQHNLTLADVERHARLTNRRVVSEKYDDARANVSWKLVLINTVASAHLCKAIINRTYVPGRGNRVTFDGITVVGHEHNLIVVRQTWHWLMAEAERLAKLYHHHAKFDLLDGRAASEPVKWKNDFKMGFTTGVDEAYAAVRRSLEDTTPINQWAIVPLLECEVAEAFDALFPSQGSGRKTFYRATDAYQMGVNEGKRVNTGRQVGGAESRPALPS